MKTKLLLVWAMLIGYSSFAQIQGAGGLPKSNLTNQHYYIPTVHFDEPNIEALRQEDSLVDAQKAGPWRFGFNHESTLTLNTTGSWLNLADGGKIWRVKIVCENALTVNLTLNNVVIPDGNELYVYNEDKSFILGKFTKNHLCEGVLGTELVPGKTAIVEYYVAPNNAIGSFNFETITHGYRTATEFAEKAFGGSGNCNNNANCPSGAGWQNEKRSVVMLVSGSNGFCTGALVNNTLQNGKPYVLTANHCYSNPTNWIFRFNWESTDCVNPGTSPSFTSINGSILRARNTPSDFCLVEMTATSGTPFVNGTVPASFNPYFAGWDATNTTPASAVGIHHPSGDIKKISFENDPLTTGILYGTPANSHWRVGYWDSGVTEPGSSGSPLFDQHHRIVGQLHGGASGCGATDLSDEYGRFSYSWNTSSDTSKQLKYWLDPNNSGAPIVDGYDPSVAILANNAGILWASSPSGMYCGDSFTPSFMLKNYGSSNLTSVTITYNIDGGTDIVYPWTGNLVPFTIETITLPTMTATNGFHTFNLTTSLPNNIADTDNSNDTYSTNFFTTNNPQSINITVTTDCFSDETSWSLFDANNNVIASNGTLSNETTVTTPVCVGEACYTFVIYDSYGDGIGGTANGCAIDGTYSVQQGGTVLASLQNVHFGSSESTNFCVVDLTCSEPLVVVLDGTTPETIANDGTINISVSGGGAPYIYTWTGPNGFTGSTQDLAGLAAGTYSVTVTDDCGNSETLSNINVTSVVGMNELAENNFKVFPNPNNGTFTIQLTDVSSDATLTVTDLFGRIIHTKKLNEVSTIISLNELAQGTYMLNVTTAKFKKTTSLMITK